MKIMENSKKREKREIKAKGITLIALIVTIIILLILAGVALSGLMKENGLIQIAIQSREESIKGKYAEAIDMVKKSVDLDKAAGDLTTKEIMDKYEEELRNDDTFKDAQITRKTDEEKDSIIVETKEGYIYEITENETKYVGKDGEGGLKTPPADAGIIKIEAEPSEPTKGPVEVTITTTRKEFKIQYSYDTTKWDYYTAPIEVTDNGTTIYARLVNELGIGSGENGVASIDILNIDTLDPESVTFSTEIIDNKIRVIATAEDAKETETSGKSGIAKYYFSNDGGTSWYPTNGQDVKTVNDYTFSNLTYEKEYQIKVKAKDNAGNEKESTQTESIKIEEPFPPKNIYIGDVVNYKPETTQTSYNIAKNMSGKDREQTITSADVIWKVMCINEDSIDIVPDPNERMPSIELDGASGYNNGVFLLNDICSKLYSNSSLRVSARSINLNDFIKQMNDTGKSTFSNDTYGKPFTIQTDNISYPKLAEYENSVGINSDTVKNDGLENSDDGTKLQEIKIPLLDDDLENYSKSVKTTTKITLINNEYSAGQAESYYVSKLFYKLFYSNYSGVNFWVANRCHARYGSGEKARFRNII